MLISWSREVWRLFRLYLLVGLGFAIAGCLVATVSYFTMGNIAEGPTSVALSLVLGILSAIYTWKRLGRRKPKTTVTFVVRPVAIDQRSIRASQPEPACSFVVRTYGIEGPVVSNVRDGATATGTNVALLVA